MDLLGKLAVLFGLLAVRRVLDDGLLAQLGMLDDVVARDEVNELGIEAGGERFGEVELAVGLALVADQPTQADAAGIGIFRMPLAMLLAA